jgi:hypothetical protein
VGDRDRSSSSSDPGSAIEGFGQKIALHHELPDLGVQLRHLGVAIRLNLEAFVVKDLRQLLDRLPLPLRAWRAILLLSRWAAEERLSSQDVPSRNLEIRLRVF